MDEGNVCPVLPEGRRVVGWHHRRVSGPVDRHQSEFVSGVELAKWLPHAVTEFDFGACKGDARVAAHAVQKAPEECPGLVIVCEVMREEADRLPRSRRAGNELDEAAAEVVVRPSLPPVLPIDDIEIAIEARGSMRGVGIRL